jgi:hypothetical protein
MAEQLPSRLAIVPSSPIDDLGALVARIRAAGGVDRASPLSGGERQLWEVHWGGRMQRALVRALIDDDGAPLLHTEAMVGADGLVAGMTRHAQLLVSLADALEGDGPVGVRDLSARMARDVAWLHRVADGRVHLDDGVDTVIAGEGAIRWIHTHGAARFGVPDLELYGLDDVAGPAAGPLVVHARRVLRAVLIQLLDGGIGAVLRLPGGPRVRLIPVLEAWSRLPLGLPGVGQAGSDRGPGLDGPRATLSISHPPRLGRHRLDLEGVIAWLRASLPPEAAPEAAG